MLITLKSSSMKSIKSALQSGLRLTLRLQDHLALSAGETRSLLVLCAFLLAGFAIQSFRVRQVGPPQIPFVEGATPEWTDVGPNNLAQIPHDGGPSDMAPSDSASNVSPQVPNDVNKTVQFSSERPGGRIDINGASAVQLDELPGVGPAIAARIIAWRTSRGPFQSVADLQRVRGIGPATLARIGDRAFVGGVGQSSSSAVPLSELNSGVEAVGDSTQSLLASSSRSRNR